MRRFAAFLSSLAVLSGIVVFCAKLSPGANDLNGIWVQTNSPSENTYQEAQISNGSIEVYWVDELNNSRFLVWSGTYEKPPAKAREHSWVSINNKQKTEASILSLDSNTKLFSYKKGQLSYSVPNGGETQTINLKRKHR
ncbi:MAG: hypothetical protein FWG10_07710 [Eubacteriaceae bacterium]|nr:hypothetical protein [Eubacteriaceae bacterium]